MSYKTIISGSLMKTGTIAWTVGLSSVVEILTVLMGRKVLHILPYTEYSSDIVA